MKRWITFFIIVVVIAVSIGSYMYLTARSPSMEKVGEESIPIPGEIADTIGSAGENIVFSVDDFSNGSMIPVKYTCDGGNTSPEIIIEEKPRGVKTYVLIMYDPDAPRGVFYHWILFNIPGNISRIPPGIPMKPSTGYGLHGLNDAHKLGYFGPCPPSGRHRYVFLILALDAKLQLAPGVSVHDVLFNARGHVIGYGVYYGLYGR